MNSTALFVYMLHFHGRC